MNDPNHELGILRRQLGDLVDDIRARLLVGLWVLV
jgi:hypothetical protein